MPANLQEKEYARTIEKDPPVLDNRAGTDGDPPRQKMFKGLGGRYAGGGLSRRDKALYVGGGVIGTGALFMFVIWMMSLF
jgi:hypothetical protein